MYSRAGNSDAANMSPRSKMISLGLSAVEAPPQRYRPPVKAADFPFTHNNNNNNRGDEYQYQQQPEYNQNNQYDNGKNSYDNDYDSAYDQQSADELTAQYAEYQQRKQSEEQYYQPAPQYDDQSQYQAKSTTQLTDKQRALAKYADYQRKLEGDQAQGIEQTRQKYVRKNAADDVYANLPGLVIGNQTDKETQFRNKRDAQAAYQQQLANDQRSKPVALERKLVDRRAASPEPQHISLMSRIGDRTGVHAAEMEAAEARRREAQRLLNTHREDVLNRLTEASSPENKKFRENRAHGSVEEATKFEEAPYRFIGGSVEAAKDRKKQMQEQYLTQLLRDNGPPPSQQNKSYQAADPLASYVNKTGYTGLLIGGHSLDEAHKGASNNEKLMKQEAYRRLLDQQRVQDEDLLRQDRSKYGKY